jgi:hypothetical protein
MVVNKRPLKVAISALLVAFVCLMAIGLWFNDKTFCVSALVTLTAMAGLVTVYVVLNQTES